MALSAYSSALGGRYNLAAGKFSAVAGGAQNEVWARDSFAIGHDAKVQNCQQSTAVLGYQPDTSDDMCQFNRTIQQVRACVRACVHVYVRRAFIRSFVRLCLRRLCVGAFRTQHYRATIERE